MSFFNDLIDLPESESSSIYGTILLVCGTIVGYRYYFGNSLDNDDKFVIGTLITSLILF